MTSTHFLRIEPGVFRELAQGRQHALCLPLSLGAYVGDQLVLREWRSEGRGVFTGVWIMRRVTSVFAGDGVRETHAVYSLNTGADNERATVVLKRELAVADKQGVAADRFFRHREKAESLRRERLARSVAVVARVRAQSREVGASTGALEERSR